MIEKATLLRSRDDHSTLLVGTNEEERLSRSVILFRGWEVGDAWGRISSTTLPSLDDPFDATCCVE